MNRLGMPQLAIALTRIKTRTVCGTLGCVVLTLMSGITVWPQTRTYPKEIRGYKVERTVIEVKKPGAKNVPSKPDQEPASNSDAEVDELIQLGKPELARMTPLGITFAVPIVVSPITKSGHVDFLVFEDMVINGTSVTIDEYKYSFDLPNKRSLTLGEPLRIYIYLSSAVLATTLGDWNDSKDTWPVTGRVYVFGKFKKGPFSFKRVVPVELNVTMRNPLGKR